MKKKINKKLHLGMPYVSCKKSKIKIILKAARRKFPAEE